MSDQTTKDPVSALVAEAASHAIAANVLTGEQVLAGLSSPMQALAHRADLRAKILAKIGMSERLARVLSVDNAEGTLADAIEQKIILSRDVLKILSVQEWVTGVGVQAFWPILLNAVQDNDQDRLSILSFFLNEGMARGIIQAGDVVPLVLYDELAKDLESQTLAEILRALDDACREKDSQDPRKVVLDTLGVAGLLDALPHDTLMAFVIQPIEQKLGLAQAPSSPTDAEVARETKQEVPVPPAEDPAHMEEGKDEDHDTIPPRNMPTEEVVEATEDDGVETVELDPTELEMVGAEGESLEQRPGSDTRTAVGKGAGRSPAPAAATPAKAPVQAGTSASRSGSGAAGTAAAPRPGNVVTRKEDPLRRTSPLGGPIPQPVPLSPGPSGSIPVSQRPTAGPGTGTRSGGS